MYPPYLCLWSHRGPSSIHPSLHHGDEGDGGTLHGGYTAYSSNGCMHSLLTTHLPPITHLLLLNHSLTLPWHIQPSIHSLHSTHSGHILTIDTFIHALHTSHHSIQHHTLAYSPIPHPSCLLPSSCIAWTNSKLALTPAG